MNEMIRNNLTVATMQVNVQFLQQLQPEWSRFVTIVKQQHKLDEVSYHKLFDILKQYQKGVNDLCAERMAKNANPLALVVTAQTLQDLYYQSSKPHKSYAPTLKPSLPTKSHATTRYKGKEIAKPITPLSESASEEDSAPEQAQRDKDMHKKLALIAKYFKNIYKPTNNNLRTSSNTRNKNVDTTPRYKNDNQTEQFRNQRAVNVAGARETVASSQESSSNVQPANPPFEHLNRWTKDHPLDNVIGNPSRPVSTRCQLQTDAMWCFFDAFLTSVDKNFKDILLESSWIDAMQEEIYEFE
ncbi:hypothetical protein Tco_0206246 [Tanacetum coccineum]